MEIWHKVAPITGSLSQKVDGQEELPSFSLRSIKASVKTDKLYSCSVQQLPYHWPRTGPMTFCGTAKVCEFCRQADSAAAFLPTHVTIIHQPQAAPGKRRGRAMAPSLPSEGEVDMKNAVIEVSDDVEVCN